MEAIASFQSDRFDFKRFKSYFSLYVTSNKRKILLGCSLFVIVPFLLTIFIYAMGGDSSYKTGYYSSSSNVDPFWHVEFSIFMFLDFIFMALAGSMMFGNLTGKKSRLNTIELPATQSEKFLTWWLLYLPIALVLMMVCFWISDILRVMWMWLFTPYGLKVHVYPLSDLISISWPGDSQDSSDIRELAWFTYSLFIASNAIFALGGIFFHRYSFLKTVAAGFVATIIYSLVFVAGINIFFSAQFYRLTNRFDINPDNMFLIVTCVIFAICIGIYWLCYARYKEEDIINRW